MLSSHCSVITIFTNFSFLHIPVCPQSNSSIPIHPLLFPCTNLSRYYFPQNTRFFRSPLICQNPKNIFPWPVRIISTSKLSVIRCKHYQFTALWPNRFSELHKRKKREISRMSWNFVVGFFASPIHPEAA